MRNSKFKLKYVALILGTILSSCTKDFSEINRDPIGTTSTTANQLLAPALVNVLSANMRRNRDFNNELMQVTVGLSDAEGQVFRYDFRRNWADFTWNAWYPEITNFRDMYIIASDPKTLNKSYQGIALICQTWTYSLLTDMYGDVPYSEANQGKVENGGIIEPKYDAQKDIYLDMYKKLEEANTALAAGTPIIATGDPVFSGDVAKWRKFGNSLYLRLLLRASRKADVSAQVIAKIKEIVDTNSANYPIMATNSDTAKILWNGTNSSTAVYSNPWMVNVRPVDFRGIAITSFFIDRIRDWGNPNLTIALGKNGTNRWGIAQGSGGFSGVPSGYVPGTGVVRQSYFQSDAQVANGYTLQTDPYAGIIMNVAEVDFIIAEAAVKGWSTKSAATYYNKGVFDAINYWLPTYATSPTAANFVTYMTLADIDWDAGVNALPVDAPPPASSGGPVNSKMEMIHIQKYYALFLVDMQQWFEYRRTGHPFLPKGGALANGGVMPARMFYPVISQSTNPTGYKNAVAQQGPDEMYTQVWWQKP